MIRFPYSGNVTDLPAPLEEVLDLTDIIMRLWAARRVVGVGGRALHRDTMVALKMVIGFS